MAGALVGTAAAVSTGAAGAAVTPAWGTGQNRTANNTLICCVAVTGTATLPATPSGWGVMRQNAGTSCSATIFSKLAAGADAAPTIAAITSGTINAQLGEYSGLLQQQASGDQSAAAQGTSTPIVATCGAVDAAVGELVVGCGVAINSSARANTMSHTINNCAGDVETSNGATSTVSHYCFTQGATTSRAAATSDSFAFQTTQLTGATVVVATFKLGPVSLTRTSADTVTVADTAKVNISMARTASDGWSITTPSTYDAIVRADGPAMYWRLNDTGSTAVDQMGVANGTYSGAGPQAQQDLLPASAGNSYFSRSGNDYMRATNPMAVGGSAPCTIEAWMNCPVGFTGATYPRPVLGSGNFQLMLYSQTTVAVQFGGSAYVVTGATFTWGVTHHVVAVSNGDGSCVVYLDGKQAWSGDLIAGNAYGGTGNPAGGWLNVGDVYGQGPTGYMQELAIYTKALTASQVFTHYGAGVGKYAATVQADAPATFWQLNESYSTYPAAVIADGPCNYWRLNDTGSTFADQMGNTPSSTLASPPASGQNQKDLLAISPGGSFWTENTGFVRQSTSYGGAGGSFLWDRYTVECWAQMTAYYAYMNLVVNNGNYGMRIGSSQTVLSVGGGSGWTEIPIGMTLQTGVTYHFAVTVDGTLATVYINGVQRGSATITKSGTAYDGIDIVSQFHGYAQEAAVYKFPLTPLQVQRHYLIGAAVAADMMNSIPGAWSGAVTYGQAGIPSGGNSALLNGAGYVRIPTQPTVQPVSLEAWVFLTAYAAAGNQDGLVCIGGIQAGAYMRLSTSGQLQALMNNQALLCQASSPLSLNAWHHCVMTSTASATVLYADGVQVASSGANTLTGTGVSAVGSSIANGSVPPGSEYLVGQIADAAVYAFALTSGQASNHFSLGNTPPPLAGGVVDSAVGVKISSFSRSASDGVGTITDSASRATLAWVRSLADAVPAISDAATRAVMPHARSASDAWTVGDSASSVVIHSFSRTAADALAVSDAATRGAIGVSRTAADSWTVSDSASRAVYARTRSSADSWTVSDSATGQKVIARSGSDTIASISDQASRATYARTRSSLDTVTISDLGTRAWVGARTAADGLSVADSATRAALHYIRSASELWAVADLPSTGGGAVKLVSDLVPLSDQATRATIARAKSAADSYTVGDAAVRGIYGRVRGGTDTLAVVDAANRTYSTARGAADSWAISDHTARGVGHVRSVVDTVIGVADSVQTRLGLAARSAFDSTTVSDVAIGVYYSVAGVLWVTVTETVASIGILETVAWLQLAESEAELVIAEEELAANVIESEGQIAIIEED